jgi:peptidoglycan/LPS O-acetylase OafA/YrhL
MRIRQLDILRAFAVLLVMGRHWWPCPEGTNPVVRVLVNAWEQCGWIGVDLFFVLSGFLIAGLLFREHRQHGSIRLKRFLIRRAFKIYPAFYVYLAFALFILSSEGMFRWSVVWSEVLFVQNYFERAWVHSWSLAVEEHFYLFLPLLLLVLIKCGRGADPFRPLVWVLFIVAPLLLGLRIWTAVNVPYTNPSHMFPTHLRIDSLLFGVALSYWHHYHPDTVSALFGRFNRLFLASGIALVLPTVWVDPSHPLMHTVGLTAVYLGFGSILMATLYRQPSGTTFLRPLGTLLAGIGVYSYSIYLWHLPMREAGLPLFRGLGGYFPGLAIYVAGSVIIGIGMSRLIEMRALKLRDRLFPALARPLAPPVKESEERDREAEPEDRDPAPAASPGSTPPAPRAAPFVPITRYR